MSGTRTGGLLAAKKNKANHGEDYYVKIGAKGGKAPGGAFKWDKELARRAGAIGGRVSRRGISPKTAEKERAEFQEGFPSHASPQEKGWLRKVTQSPDDKLRTLSKKWRREQ